MAMRILPVSLVLALSFPVYAQQTSERNSPLAVTSARYKDTYVKIVYSQPKKKNREIFGKLVPYGAVWRTGANEATELTTTRDIVINGKQVSAGTYSLFTIPNSDEWTIIINSEVGLWGSYNYNEKWDVGRWNVAVTALTDSFFESFTITLDQKNDKADVIFCWDKTSVTLSIQFIEPKP